MTKFFLKFSGLAFVLALLIATGCNEDTPIVDNPLGPEISLSGGDLELLEGEPFTVSVTVAPGDNPLNSLRLLVGGAAVPAANIADYVTKITAGTEDISQQNPLLIAASRENGATYVYEMVPFGQLEGETVTYTFEVTDKVQEKASASFDITIVAPPGTALDMELSGVLFNQAGPAGTGGLDLDNGAGTGSANTAAEIRDLGIDCNIDPATGENWRGQIGSVNGTDMKAVDVAAQPEGFSFENVKTKEEIVSAYGTGIALTDGFSTSATCVQTAVTDVSDPVAVGDLFVVKKGDVYYMFQVDEVNRVGGSNGDNYVLSIKY
ncbi:MAG: hypothetical protein H6557_26565 [Lewinellaceae bacterium]|nr:hypothetical protein [Lewinellaceae bacterium]